MSSRRIPKGPGRRPMSEKRRRFQELLAQGWTLAGACRELGIGRSTGHIWKNGTVVRRKDETVKVVPPLEPLAVRVPKADVQLIDASIAILPVLVSTSCGQRSPRILTLSPWGSSQSRVPAPTNVHCDLSSRASSRHRFRPGIGPPLFTSGMCRRRVQV